MVTNNTNNKIRSHILCFRFIQGNISDKELTSQCGLLELLKDGDSVMADKGFNVADLLNAKSVTLNIPPKLTNLSGQFSEDDRVKTRRIASVRIHVERPLEE